MKKKQNRSYLILQIIFIVLTFVGGILYFTKVLPNAILSIVATILSLIFGYLYNKDTK